MKSIQVSNVLAGEMKIHGPTILVNGQAVKASESDHLSPVLIAPNKFDLEMKKLTLWTYADRK